MKKNFASSSQLNSEQFQTTVFSQGYSTSANLFNEYLKSANELEKNVIFKIFGLPRPKRNFSDRSLVNLSISEDSSLLKKLRISITENPKFTEELKDFVIGLESLEHKLSDRANYLLGSLALFGLISGLITASVETDNLVLFNVLKVAVLCILFFASIWAIYVAWQLKGLSSKIKSFITISNSAFKNESNEALEDFAVADAIQEGLQTEKISKEEIFKILEGKN